MAIEAIPQDPPATIRNNRKGEWAELVDNLLKENPNTWYYVGIHSSGNAAYLRKQYGIEVRQQMVTDPKEIKQHGQFRARVWVMYPDQEEEDEE